MEEIIVKRKHKIDTRGRNRNQRRGKKITIRGGGGEEQEEEE